MSEMKFVKIPSGSFLMGSDFGYADEKPVHKVDIKGFEIMDCPVTNFDWCNILGIKLNNETDNYPKTNVSWNDVQEFIVKLNEMEGGDEYRLPSAAEWEYACRAGTTTRYSFGDSESDLGDYAWYGDNSGDKAQPVCQKQPNPWGLYDMHGNVCEWCQDKWHHNYKGAPVDGSAWESDDNDTHRVLRGGSWNNDAGRCRSASRNNGDPDYRSSNLGFRLVREKKAACRNIKISMDTSELQEQVDVIKKEMDKLFEMIENIELVIKDE
jgi:formylglycine-generating enzyme required for sulfatase activity